MADDDPSLFPISALQHLVYCPRQCALIHVERLWSENALTAEGRVLHSRQDEPGFETRGGVRTRRSVHVFSRSLGIWGVCDSVEETLAPDGSVLQYTPVETKHGRPKRDKCDVVQLCAQALCLEEMHDLRIGEAYLFYGETRRRFAVALDDVVRAETLRLVAVLREMVEKSVTPPPEFGPKCRACSLLENCSPGALEAGRASRYVRKIFEEN
jgi:CRISPR-associated exonuclease Cas4